MRSALGPQSTSSKLREISNPLTWVYCFLSFIAAKTDCEATRDLVAYTQIIIGLARKHEGLGWFAYDQQFRQQLAGGAEPTWNDINNSLISATVLAPQPEDGLKCTVCNICCGDDHTASECTLSNTQTAASSAHTHQTSNQGHVKPGPIHTKAGTPSAVTSTKVSALVKPHSASMSTPASFAIPRGMEQRTALGKNRFLS